MKQIARIVALLLIMATSSWAIDWGDDMDAALKQAKESDKLVLASFSGSDWCGWCIKLDKEVFLKEAFEAFAKENFILFQADFPRNVEQDAALKASNQALAGKYAVRGFPTVLLLNAKGEVVARTGYQRGGPEAYIKHLKELMAAK
jgi:protein disulfide-isomerase